MKTKRQKYRALCHYANTNVRVADGFAKVRTSSCPAVFLHQLRSEMNYNCDEYSDSRLLGFILVSFV